ncbi:MAG: hypothetical protein AAFY20_03090 [Cyanobacteria bacterium J06639_14]
MLGSAGFVGSGYESSARAKSRLLSHDTRSIAPVRLGKGDDWGEIASGAAGTPPPTAPPLGQGRTGNVAVLEMQQLVPNGQFLRGWRQRGIKLPRLRCRDKFNLQSTNDAMHQGLG